MSSLEHINQVKTEIRVDENGRGFATIRATARLAGVEPKAIRNAIQGGELEAHKNAETADLQASKGAELKLPKLTQKLLEGGFDFAQMTQWPANGIPDTAITLIVEYYTFDAGRYCTDTAKAFYRSMASVGIRSLFRQATGWTQQTPPAPQPQQKLFGPSARFPSVTQEIFNAAPLLDQIHWAESPEEELERRQRERKEFWRL